MRDILTAAKCLGDNGLEFINTVNNIGLTPLHLSVLENQTKATTLLLQFDADLSLKDFNGNTAVHIAAIDGRSIDSLWLLLNKIDEETSSAYINAQNSKGIIERSLTDEQGLLLIKVIKQVRLHSIWR